ASIVARSRGPAKKSASFRATAPRAARWRGRCGFPQTPTRRGEVMNRKGPFTLLLALLFSGCAFEANDAAPDAEALGQSESALCKNALSPSQEKTALKLIDDICGDTWCEGDNNFSFEHLTCRAGSARSASGGTCTLRLHIIPREDTPPSYSRSC